jgi:predicted outer membrane protein
MRNRFLTDVIEVSALLLVASVAGSACSTSNRDRNEAAGEVVARTNPDTGSPKPVVRWLTDANLLSLVGAMNSRQIAAADAELEAWHVDSVRAFAASVAREHAELQHSVDSLAANLHLTPIAPALTQTISTTMQAQIDSVRRAEGRALDRVFMRQQVASYQFMAGLLGQFAAVAEQPEVQALLSTAKDRSTAQLNHARALQTRLAATDSAAAADSAAKRAAKIAKRASRSALP